MARSWPLLLGSVLLAALWLGPLPEMSRTAFSMHMILHLGVVAVSAPLIAIGLQRVGFGLDGLRAPVLWAAVASAFDMLVVWGWHAPAMHEAAARNDPVFVVQQLSFLFAGVWLWAVSFAESTRSAAGIGIMAMFMTSMHMTMLGVLLTFAPDLLYSPDLCLGAFGFDRIDDQRLGGVMMGAFGGLPYLGGGLVLAYRVLSE